MRRPITILCAILLIAFLVLMLVEMGLSRGITVSAHRKVNRNDH